MKIFKKILIALCILAVLTAAVCVFVLADSAYTVAAGTELVNAYASAPAEEKDAAVEAARKYFELVDPASDGYDAYQTAYIGMEESYINDVLLPIVNAYASANDFSSKESAMKNAYATFSRAYAGASNYASFRAAVNGVIVDFLNNYAYPMTQKTYDDAYAHVRMNSDARAFLSYVTLYADTSCEEYNASGLVEKVAAVKKALDDRIAADKEALYSKATLTDYTTYPNAQFLSDFENERAGTKNPQSITAHSVNKSLGNDTSNNANLAETAKDADGNTYYHIRYNYSHYYNASGEEITVAGKHNYFDLTWATADSVVLEIDFSTEDVFPDSFTLQSPMDHNGGRIFPNWFSLANGDFSTVANTKLGTQEIAAISIPQVISPKQWTHFIVQISNAGVLTVYIDYVPIGSWDSVGNVPYIDNDYILKTMRLGFNTTKVCSYCIDNYTAYYGEHPRDVAYLSNISGNNDQLLLFYAGVIANPESKVQDKGLAVEKSASLISHYYNEETGFEEGVSEELKNAIQAILNIDMEKLNAELRTANLAELKSKAAEVEATPRTLANVQTRKAMLDAVNDFLEKNQFPTTDPEFATATMKVAQLVTYVEQDTAANTFIKEMNSFNLRFTFDSMNRHYNAGAEAYAILDPDHKYSDVNERKSFQAALEIYAGAENVMKAEGDNINSKRIIVCIDKVKNYEESAWAENYDAINPYIVTVRETIRSGNYNRDAEGLQEALAIYEKMNAFFYNVLQQKHIDELQDRVNAFRSTTSYIERIGAVKYVEQYISNNDVDLTNPTILSIVNAVDVMRSEVEKQQSEYDELLNQNTERFASAVSIMKAFNDYPTLKNYYNKATEYFYSMNIVIYGEENEVILDVTDAISDYHAIGDKLAQIEKASAELVEVTASYQAAETVTKDLTYRYLVACYRLVENTDDSIEGVTAAKTGYQSALAAYNAEILPLNNEIVIAADAMCAVRAICNLKGIMSMIRSILY